MAKYQAQTWANHQGSLKNLYCGGDDSRTRSALITLGSRRYFTRRQQKSKPTTVRAARSAGSRPTSRLLALQEARKNADNRRRFEVVRGIPV
jgi:hypothetical protein